MDFFQLIKFFLAIFLFISTAHAERFVFIRVAGEKAMSAQHARWIVNDAFGLIERDLGLKMKAVRFRSMGDIKVPNNLASFSSSERFYALGKKAMKKFPECASRTTFCHIIDAPIVDEGIIFIGGRARICAYRSNTAFGVSNAAYVNTDGKDFYLHSVIACAHEIGHQLGLWHHSGPNIMDPSALKYVTQYGWELSFFGEVAIAENKACSGARD